MQIELIIQNLIIVFFHLLYTFLIQNIKKYFKAELKFLNEITKETRFIKEKQNVLKDRIDTIIRFSALVYIKDSDLSLKIKVKSVVGYVDHYKNCEIEYKSTPSSFLLEWED